MPSSHQSPASTLSAGRILLLEEYDAIAAAIGSALKKFAPRHAVSRARSLAEAERLASELNPELFVFDVDPPWPGITGFLEKLKTSLPKARVLVIGAAIPEEIAAERGSFGALQFIGKPFELAAFGAAVQAVLGPWREPGSASPRGNLGMLTTVDVLLLHCAAAAKVILTVKAGTEPSGKIWVADGQVAHAESSNLSGLDALRLILNWRDARVTEAKLKSVPKRSVRGDWLSTVVEILARTKPPPGAPQLSPADELPREPEQPKSKKIVAVDDTEMLLIFVEDVLVTADPNLQIITASNGAEGVQRIGEVLPDLVLLDYNLPDFNGDEVCRHLLENARTAHVPVLMMSGHVAAMKATADRFSNIVATIEKPFLSDALVQLVRKTLAAGPRERPVVEKKAEAPVAKQVPPSAPPPRPAPPVEARPATVTMPVMPVAPLTPAILQAPQPQAPPRPVVRVSAGEQNIAVLGLFLEVISMQLTPQLQMGAIRGRPASPIVSLHLSSQNARGAILPETGFQLGPTHLDANGRISTLQLFPTARPFQPAQTRAAFEIGGVALIPNHTRARVQLTPAGTTPMTVQLLAHLELRSVQLSSTFQVAQLILNWRTNRVRVTLDPKAADKAGAGFEPVEVKLDGAGRIAEILLKPA